jgi:hypothetical protein
MPVAPLSSRAPSLSCTSAAAPAAMVRSRATVHCVPDPLSSTTPRAVAARETVAEPLDTCAPPLARSTATPSSATVKAPVTWNPAPLVTSALPR